MAGCARPRRAEHLEWHAEGKPGADDGSTPRLADGISRRSVNFELVKVCAAFTPWNYPLSQAVKKVAAAIGAGCSLILKGSEESPSAVVALARLFHDAGLPPGVLNIVWGEPAQVCDYLIRLTDRARCRPPPAPGVNNWPHLAGQYLKRTTLSNWAGTRRCWCSTMPM